MRSARKWRPSPALVISFGALFVALSGTALALNANSVRSKHIVNGQVKPVDLKNGAVNDRKLSPKAFNPTDIGRDPNSTDPVGKFGILPDAVSTGEVENRSLRGDDLEAGTIGGLELGGVVTRAATVSVPGGTGNPWVGGTTVSLEDATASCDSLLDTVIGGGVEWIGASDAERKRLLIHASHYNASLNGWTVFGANNNTTAKTMRVEVYCLTA